MCFPGIVVVDGAGDFVVQVSQTFGAAALKHSLMQQVEPDLHVVEPRGVGRREMQLHPATEAGDGVSHITAAPVGDGCRAGKKKTSGWQSGAPS